MLTSGAGHPSEAFEGQIEFETLLSDLSSRFVNLPPADVDREIEGALRRVCEPLGIDLAVLWQWSDASGVIVPTHAWCAVESQRPSEPMRQDQYPWAARQMREGVPVIFSSLAELPADAPVDRETCARLGIKSNVTLPLILGGEALRVLESTGWRVKGASGAAAVLAINPSTLRSRMKKLGIALRGPAQHGPA